MSFNDQNRTPWWRTKPGDTAEQLFADIVFLDDNQPYTRERNHRSLRLYSDMQWASLATSGSTGANFYDSVGYNSQSNRITLNVIRSVVDTASNRIGQSKPRPFALTFKGNFTQQSRAKRLNQFMQGQFAASDVYSAGQNAFVDAALTGTGAVKNYEVDGKIVCERVWIDELMVDEQEAIYGKPRQLFQVRTVSKDLLRGLYPEKKYQDAIDGAGVVRDDDESALSLTDMATVVEAWHLPSSAKAKDGRHVISISNKLLLDEPWEKHNFPFSFVRWGQRRLGFWGEGLVDNLKGIQYEINLILRKIQTLMRLATSHVFIHKGSKIVKSHLSNEDWGVIEFVGQQPIFATIQAVSPEYFAQLDRLYTRAFEQSGVTELSATGKKPTGLNSGRALIEYADLQSGRFALIGQELERFYMDIAEQEVQLAKDISDRDGKYAVITMAGREVELVDWAEIDLARDQYLMQIYPTGFLPQTPAGKWEIIAQMMETGFLEKDEAAALLDYPDLESITSLNNSPIHFAELTIETMMDKGRYVPPDPHSNLPLNIRMVTFALLRAETNSAPEDRLELLRQYIADANAMLTQLALEQQAEAAQAAQAALPPAAAQGAAQGAVPEVIPGPEGALPELGPIA